MNNIVVCAADIGSIKRKSFGWSRAEIGQDNPVCGTNIAKFTESIVDDFKKEKKVALGFECPLFVPISDKPEDLTKARKGEKNRPWSAGAGSNVLTIGLAECVWIFERIRESNVDVKPTFKWKDFLLDKSNFFIWEAFVTSASKGNSHCDDAKLAVNTFKEMYKNSNDIESSISAHKPYSLVGAGLLRSRLTEDRGLLFENCIVIKVDMKKKLNRCKQKQ
ncbi:MAG TPA: hypothetical protein HA257_09310 [Candidatus Methanoperedenaceae archaeon]|nr:hypothetical protein [Candidatus Methanoperedenaceae archaeon]